MGPDAAKNVLQGEADAKIFQLLSVARKPSRLIPALRHQISVLQEQHCRHVRVLQPPGFDLLSTCLLVQADQVCIAGSCPGNCVAGKVCHLQVLQPSGVDQQAVPLLIQNEVVDIKGHACLQQC